MACICSAFIELASNFVARFEQLNGQGADSQEGGTNHRQAEPRRDITLAKEAVSEAINHVEKWVQVTDALPKGGQ
jgi:hypothetical protein